ncbi:unnamed protein product [Diplocarpon coronariae]|nr:hypothetical protein JHW43_008418 [Diplocarpon mali]
MHGTSPLGEVNFGPREDVRIPGDPRQGKAGQGRPIGQCWLLVFASTKLFCYPAILLSCYPPVLLCSPLFHRRTSPS